MPSTHICREWNSCTPTLQLYDCYLHKTCMFNVALRHTTTPSDTYDCRKSSPMQVLLAGMGMYGTLTATTHTSHTRSPKCVWQHALLAHCSRPSMPVPLVYSNSYGLAFC